MESTITNPEMTYHTNDQIEYITYQNSKEQYKTRITYYENDRIISETYYVNDKCDDKGPAIIF